MDLNLAATFLDRPIWLWGLFAAAVAGLLAFDLGVLHRKAREIPLRESLWLSAVYIAIAVAFGVWTWATLGSDAGAAFFSGYLLEKSLSLDNIFVISAIFGFLAIPREHQHRVLFWGILSVLVLRALLIGLGAALVHEFAWVLPAFGAFLLYAGYRIARAKPAAGAPVSHPVFRLLLRHLPVTDSLHGGRFFARQPAAEGGRARLAATPLFLALVLVELSDVLFAIDSVPAIFAITTDTYIVYTSNIFAVLGLRALYFALSDVIRRFEHLKVAMGLLLGLAGVKIFYNVLVGKIDPLVSLSVTLSVLIGGVAYSLWRTRRDAGREAVDAPANRPTDREAAGGGGLA
ncbi:MAG TPA: TerC family protein [Caulobacter sp.]|nr:TerC family protein [Caulobacter sp.]